jgi:hypothetical protein
MNGAPVFPQPLKDVKRAMLAMFCSMALLRDDGLAFAELARVR